MKVAFAVIGFVAAVIGGCGPRMEYADSAMWFSIPSYEPTAADGCAGREVYARVVGVRASDSGEIAVDIMLHGEGYPEQVWDPWFAPPA